MPPLSSRLLARYEVRSVPLQPQRRLKSTNTARNDFAELLQWARTQITKNQPNRSRSLPRNAQGDRPYKPKRIKQVQSSLGDPPNAKAREKGVWTTVLTAIRNDAALAPEIGSWPGEDWKTDGWGQDSKP